MTVCRGIVLTICLAIKCWSTGGKGRIPSICFAADTQESSTILKRSVTKLRGVQGHKPEKGEAWEIEIASSGDAMIIDEALQKIQYFLWKQIKPEEKEPSTSLLSHREGIANLAYDTYKKYMDRDVENPYFELMLGAADESSTILHVTHEGKTQESGRFGIIGSGRVTGGELLLGEFLREDMEEYEAAFLASLVVSTVGHVDIFVGGEPDMYFCRARRTWMYAQDDYRMILEKSGHRWDLLKKTWVKMLEDSTWEGKLEKLLEG